MLKGQPTTSGLVQYCAAPDGSIKDWLRAGSSVPSIRGTQPAKFFRKLKYDIRVQWISCAKIKGGRAASGAPSPAGKPRVAQPALREAALLAEYD